MLVLTLDGTPCEINEREILYFSSYRNTIHVHTEKGEYIYPTSLSELHDAYSTIGFEKLDRSNVVNVNNISEYDAIRKVVKFGASDKYTVVSEPNEKKVKKLLEDREKQ
ncbi:LytTR family DNA-binding domain-containing protein [Paenibacillus yanchengensis]|uniref:LytTR family DNA-binding domain-containing protein n=1 Tax=Paenibacillus yanchengensis TaxID=2035833 RepID=A0ABW4YG65_9BACL